MLLHNKWPIATLKYLLHKYTAKQQARYANMCLWWTDSTIIYKFGSAINITAQSVIHGSVGDPGQSVWPHGGVRCTGEGCVGLGLSVRCTSFRGSTEDMSGNGPLFKPPWPSLHIAKFYVAKLYIIECLLYNALKKLNPEVEMLSL